MWHLLADVGHGATKEGAAGRSIGGLCDKDGMAQRFSGKQRATSDGGEKALTNEGRAELIALLV